MTILKKDYEACFKEGFKLGTRLTRSKLSYMRAKDAEIVGDKEMATHYREYGKTWRDMAKNSGRKFTPTTAHEPNQRTNSYRKLPRQTTDRQECKLLIL